MSEILDRLSGAGVAIWLDDISRERLDSGNLADLIRERNVVGVTSNPTIFSNALSRGNAYDAQLADLAARGVGIEEAARMITTRDIRAACDVLRPVYDRTGGVDGRVSIEVDPRLAHETEATIAEARQLWWLVDRPNLFVKIPATLEGLPAISTCLSEGISVNVTLIFSLERYANVIDAFFEGIERAVQKEVPVAGIGSVASFFVSRVDAEIDKRLDKAGHPELKGRAAVANARLAYELYERKFGTGRWRALADAGARPQRPLWASTGTKDPAYSDTLYVDELVVSGVVNTMPEKTLDAVADHGLAGGATDTVHGTYDESRRVFADLAAAGVDYDDVVAVLEREGVDKFAASWSDLLDTVRGELAAKRA